MPALGRARGGLDRGARRPGLPRRAGRAAARLRGPAVAAVPRAAAVASTPGARVYLKREDLNHTGSHKINNALGQALLARRMGKQRVIAETGAGQHGVATRDGLRAARPRVRRLHGRRGHQAPEAQRRADGAARRDASSRSRAGTGTLKDATSEAIRDWVTNVATTHYIIGSAVGPAPYPALVRDLQRVIGDEARAQILEREGRLPDRVIACVGGGSNAIGIFTAFVADAGVELIGVEAAGEGMDTGRHGAPLTVGGRAGVLHGSLSAVMQDAEGQITEAHSISAGLDYPGSGPEHAHLRDSGRARYVAVDRRAGARGLRDGDPAGGHHPGARDGARASHCALEEPSDSASSTSICLSGRGDKDLAQVLAQRSSAA